MTAAFRAAFLPVPFVRPVHPARPADNVIRESVTKGASYEK
ncbi:hypothetical protein B14911_24641 [Bacillus sp. NRRL B-14911]|nr:hypothetical protein B14911_24641 [Bacillus sp. NRRL B-14911]